MTLSRNRSKIRGFTIVELLIVIVVIAVLAAISIIAYNGIQNRTNNSAVQSDLSMIIKKMEIYNIDHNDYPSASDSDLAAVDMTITKSAYDTTIGAENFYYCRNSDSDNYAIIVRAKSGDQYYIDSAKSGIQTYSGAWGSNNVCGVVGMTNYTRLPGRSSGYNWKYWL